MRSFIAAVGLVLGAGFLGLAAVKVSNELKMTKAYDAQAAEQKRVADILEAEKDLKATEFTSEMTCTTTRARTWQDAKTKKYVGRQSEYIGINRDMRVEDGGVKLFVECGPGR